MIKTPMVYVVDDDPGALRSLCWLIRQAKLQVRAFRSGREFLESYSPDGPACLLLDFQMPEMSGLEIQQRLAENNIELAIIFITAHGDIPACAQAFRLGAIDFLEKPVDGKALLNRIREALARAGERQERERLVAELGTRLSQLTPREKEVLDLLVSGKSLKEIAALSDVRIETVWKHRVSIYGKMKVENDVELVRLITLVDKQLR
jgi:two-component system response regulator FixJ